MMDMDISEELMEELALERALRLSVRQSANQPIGNESLCQLLKERVGLTAYPLPLPSCFRRKTRRVLLVSSILRVVLILATIPLAVKSVDEANFPGENHIFTFYWADLLVILVQWYRDGFWLCCCTQS